MTNIVIGCVPVEGHLAPLLAVAQHLVDRVDTVTLLTGSRFGDRVERTGARHVALPAEADFDDQSLEAYFPGRAAKRGLSALAFDVEHIFVRPARGQYAALTELTKSADVVIVDPTFAGGAYYTSLEPSERPPVVVAGVLPLSLNSAFTAPFGMGIRPARFANRTRNRILAVGARRVIGPAQRVAEATHLELHGRPMPGNALDWMRRADAIAQFTVPDFEYTRPDAPKNLHFVGPVPAPVGHDVPVWWDDLNTNKPIVHVTQGTIANKDFSQLVGPALEAMGDRDVLVVVATGGRQLSELPPLPSNARAATFLPYEWLLPRLSAYVTNGGYGGVNLALRHGVPIVVTGGKEDKPEVGARIAWAGVGCRLRSERPCARTIGRAIDTVLTNPTYRQQAERIAATMNTTNALSGTSDVIDDLLRNREQTR